MKIIHSLWTKPMFKNGIKHVNDRFSGGWLEPKHNYMSWVLSCLQFKKFYPEIELVTDAFGKEILVEKIGLPYSKVHVCLDVLNDFHPDLWALGKIYAYSMQNSPFLHVDGDAYIWEKFSNEFENNELIAQNEEKNFPMYAESINEIESNFTYIPESFRRERKINSDIIAYNAGIFGGTDVDFFQEYSKEVFQFVEKNRDNLRNINIGVFNMIYEQYLFHCMAKERSKIVKCFKKDVDVDFQGFGDFAGVPKKSKYIHVLGEYKKQKHIGIEIERRLILDYPEYYYRILNLLSKNEL